MAALFNTVLEQALELSERERGDLAARLLRSIEEPVGEAAWTAELDDRVAEIRNGTADLVDGDQAFAEARARLKSRR